MKKPVRLLPPLHPLRSANSGMIPATKNSPVIGAALFKNKFLKQ